MSTNGKLPGWATPAPQVLAPLGANTYMPAGALVPAGAADDDSATASGDEGSCKLADDDVLHVPEVFRRAEPGLTRTDRIRNELATNS